MTFAGLFYDIFPAETKVKNPIEYKIVCAGPEEKVVGLHTLGDNRGEMLQEFGVAIKMGATKKDFDNCGELCLISILWGVRADENMGNPSNEC
jgi:glutathione reductase (NADPH)